MIELSWDRVARMSRFNKILSVLPLLFTAFIAYSLLAPSTASALSGSDWRAGRIIDDGVFFNSGAISAANIQQFLNSKVPSCDTNGTKQSTHWNSSANRYYTRAEWGSLNGSPAPYTCLRNYQQDTPTRAAESGLCGVYYGGTKSSSQIIYDVAQSCGVNPQVLLVLLQKEQALVTDEWPWSTQYQKATGYGCPDTAPCDSQYYGFFNQVYNAARIYKKYARDAANYNYVAFRNNTVRYNPDAGCGGGNVFIENQATAGLYIYTPYQPNSAALNNLYGTGDSCSAYGNRNFWRMFNDWFGETYGQFYATYHSQSAFPTMKQGETADISLSYKNAGTTTWYDSAAASDKLQSPIVLATLNPVNRGSDFYDTSWYNASRPTGLFSKVYESDGVTLAPDQHSAKPGQIVQYNIKLKTPSDYKVGSYREYFAPIREGSPGWYIGADNVFMNVTVENAYTASFVGQSNYPSVQQNDNANVFIKYKNSGVATWYDSTTATANGQKPVVLAADWPINRGSEFNAGWDRPSRPATTFSKVYESDGVTLASNQHAAQPGQIVEFAFTLTAPQSLSQGAYREYFSVIREGAREYGVANTTAYLNVNVQKSEFEASYSSQSPYPTIRKGESANVYVRYRNAGTTRWYDSSSAPTGIKPVNFATTWSINRGSVFYSPTWTSASRPATTFSKVYESDGVTLASNQHAAQPGQIVEFAFTLTAPSNGTGTYREYFQPILEGAAGWNAWNIGGTVWLRIDVVD